MQPIYSILFVCFILFRVGRANNVEVLFAIDERVIDRYMYTDSITRAEAVTKVNEDAEYIITEAAEIIAKSSGHGLTLNLKVRQISILGANVFTECDIIDSYKVHVDIGMYRWKNYIETNSLFSSLSYDAAIIWTGFELVKESLSPTVSGYASLAAACDEKGVGVVEFKGTMGTAFVTAHEILHILAAEHDTSTNCYNQPQYIMASSTSPRGENKWDMTSCTAQSITTFINNLDSSDNCFTSANTNTASTTPSALPNTDIENPNIICKRGLNDTSAFANFRFGYYTGNSIRNICQAVACSRSGSPNSATYVDATDGMICGAAKRCYDGQCQPQSGNHPVPTSVTDSCPFGDQQEISYSGQTACSALVANAKHLCYQSFVKDQVCCSSCEAASSGVTGCEWGDLYATTCASYRPENICPYSGNHQYCCETCQPWMKKRSANRDIRNIIKLEPENPPPVPEAEVAQEGDGSTTDVAS